MDFSNTEPLHIDSQYLHDFRLSDLHFRVLAIISYHKGCFPIKAMAEYLGTTSNKLRNILDDLTRWRVLDTKSVDNKTVYLKNSQYFKKSIRSDVIYYVYITYIVKRLFKAKSLKKSMITKILDYSFDVPGSEQKLGIATGFYNVEELLIWGDTYAHL